MFKVEPFKVLFFILSVEVFFVRFMEMAIEHKYLRVINMGFYEWPSILRKESRKPLTWIRRVHITIL